MKINRFFSLILAFSILFSCLMPAVHAEEITGETETDELDEDFVPHETEVMPEEETELGFGSVCILKGCRTIDGYVPLAGSDRKLDTAQAVFCFERNTGTVIYSYNPDTRVSPGVLAKIVTAMVTLDHCKLDDKVIVSSRNISRLPAGSNNQNLKQDEELTVEQLLNCLILANANDAAIALAEHVAGNQESFVALMNQRVQDIGCTATEFSNVHGLETSVSYTTARDMARIVMDATRSDTFREMFGQTEYTVPETNRSEERKLQSVNYLRDPTIVQKFYNEKVTGGMQSVSPAAGASVVFTADSKGLDIIGVVIGCKRELYENGWQVKVYGNFEEAQILINYVYKNFKTARVLYRNQALKQFTVSGGECDLIAAPQVDIDTVLFANTQMRNLIMYYNDNGLKAPIAQDDSVATVQVWYGASCLMEAELFAMDNVQSVNNASLTVEGGANRKTSDSSFARVVGIGSLVILVPAVGYLTINAILRSRRRAQHRRRRSGRRRSKE